MSESERHDDEAPASDGGDAIRAEFNWGDVAPSTAVIETVAIAANREPISLEPLYDSIDPDALNTLIQSGGSNPPTGKTTVTFTFEGHEVTVHRNGTIVVRPIGTRTDPE